jgi:hypothetical protein
MTIKEIGEDIILHVREGRDWDAIQKHYSPEIVSVEADGNAASGLEGLKAKHEWWTSAHEVHSVEAEGPFLNQNQFSAIYTMDLTDKASGARFNMKEVAVYTVADDKITHEAFYYTMG